MRCPPCGEEVPADSRFCPFCGHAIAAAGTDATAPVDPSDETQAADPGTTQAVEPDATRALDPASRRADPATTQRVGAGGHGVDATQVVTTPARGASRECPSCGATNSARRELCGRCGSDLETGSRTAAGPVDLAEHGEEDDGDVRWTVLIVVGALVLIGAIVGLVLWLGADTDEPVDRPTFDEGVYPEDPALLDVANVSASSALGGDDGEVRGGELTVDGRPDTAWMTASDGVGETLLVRFPDPVWIDRVAIWNGDQSDEDAFRTRARAERIALHVADGPTIEVSLADVSGQQGADLPDPVLVRTVTIEVLGTYPAEEGLALSGLGFRGWEARGADRER